MNWKKIQIVHMDRVNEILKLGEKYRMICNVLDKFNQNLKLEVNFLNIVFSFTNFSCFGLIWRLHLKCVKRMKNFYFYENEQVYFFPRFFLSNFMIYSSLGKMLFTTLGYLLWNFLQERSAIYFFIKRII